jgi:putative MATE family efflux protein
MAAVFFGAPLFLWLLGASSPDMDPAVMPLGITYLRIISSTIILASLLFVGMACMRGAGDTQTPLYVMLGVNLSNVFITWLLVSGNLSFPALGVYGAAVGTAIARGGGGLVVLWLLWRGREKLRLDFNLRPDMDIIRRLLRIGAPTAGEMFIFHAALLVFTRFVTSMGTVSYAAHIATINIESLSFLPGLGYAVAASALVGQGLGAKSPRRAEDSAYEAVWQGMAFMTFVGLVMVIFPDVLLGIFVNDPAVVETGTAPLRAAGLVQPALAVNFILNGALRGAGDTRWPMFSRVLGTWLVRLPLAALLVGVLGMGLNGIWLAMCADFTVQAMLALWRFGSGRWQTVEV